MVETNKRILSIDTLRGLDFVWIMGIDSLLIALAKAWPNAVTAFAGDQMVHVSVGLHFEDLIFPTFMFLSGCSWPFSMASRLGKGDSRGRITLSILRRVLVMVTVGFLLCRVLSCLPAWQFPMGVRIHSLFGHIGFAWGVMALVTLFVPRRWWLVGIGSYLVYLAFFLVWPDVNARFDAWLAPGHLAGPAGSTYELESFFSTNGSIPTAFLGYWAGDVIRRADITGFAKTLRLLVAGVVCGILGTLFWAFVMPCSKIDWNPTFILCSGSFALLALAALYYVIDVRGVRAWTFPFKVIGMNAILCYTLQNVISFPSLAHRYFLMWTDLVGVPAAWVSVIDLGAGFILLWLLLYYCYRRKVFLRM